MIKKAMHVNGNVDQFSIQCRTVGENDEDDAEMIRHWNSFVSSFDVHRQVTKSKTTTTMNINFH